ncbi:hypothetical protein [Paractinoplanes durhamensis]|uniref:Uncharacterized protein n=1 Tax=Paractinoplanes durhamensis TaxID=113563 RepID=A0ABQ3Z7W7_9ACTN|nr:hypothetical protein [Actinoplanes durhamensis]GIE05932.1 hypothetical protein Adu01nite_72820 [Actinoplanes durhamensis]
MPTAVLFGRVWQQNSDARSQTDLEKQGVEYITALAPLVSALAESQSSALQGITAPPESLATAVAKVTAVDTAVGDDLKTKERWTDLQAKIAKLNKTTGGPVAILQAHTEVTDLALALYDAVRRNSELNRDPDSDLSNLQQAAAVDMPATVIRVSRMADFAQALPLVTGQARTTIAIQFGQEVLAVQDSVNALTGSLQAAVDNTSSPTLSGGLVTTLDSFRRGVESMTRGANPGGTPNVATMSTAQTALQTALNALAGVTLKEMANLLDDRSSSLNYRRGEAIAMGLLAVLLVLAALVLPILGRRRDTEEAASGPSTGVGESTRDIPTNRPAAPYGGQYDLTPAFGDNDPRRERSGALR